MVVAREHCRRATKKGVGEADIDEETAEPRNAVASALHECFRAGHGERGTRGASAMLQRHLFHVKHVQLHLLARENRQALPRRHMACEFRCRLRGLSDILYTARGAAW